MNETPKPKSGWRTGRHILAVLAILATLIAIFYTEEDWRGKRAWENCKRNLEAQGVVLDWNKFIPPPVPDDQNFFTASTNIFLRFQRFSDDDTNEIEAANQLQWLKLDPNQTNRGPLFPVLDTATNAPIVVAKIFIPRQPGLAQESNALVVSLDDPAAPERVRKLIQATMGQIIAGAQGFEFSQFQLTNIQPAQIFVEADTAPSATGLEGFIPSETIGEHGRLLLAKTANPNIFQVQLTKNIRITSAADYLAWSDQFVTAFNDIREALKRPYAILPGDYSKPYLIPIPNFVLMRSLAQTLAQRAQCDFLLGQPDNALQELTLIHDVCRILEKPPAGQPETLVEAMINVAIAGLYTQIISEGFQRHVWQVPQLEVLQGQLAQVDLPPAVKRSFAGEVAGNTYTLESVSTMKLEKLFSNFSGRKRMSVWQNIMDWKQSFLPLLRSALIPRGWIYQNMATSAILMQRQTGGFDSPEGLIQPEKFIDISRAFDKIPKPYKFIAAELIPNLTKAWQTTAYNQTMVNEGQIACALERCRLVHGEYPDSLEVLAPGYLQTIPHDIIGGQPLHYRRTEDGKFLLYSVGWNERDDGGKKSPITNNGRGNTGYAQGDWVWPN